MSRAGVRTALPNRSAITAAAAWVTVWVSASSGTATTVITYPVMVIGQ